MESLKITTQTVKAAMEAIYQQPQPQPQQQTQATTQLVKLRVPPAWIGQKFDKWKQEIEKWKENNRATEEDKYVDLVESLKKNDSIKDFVTKTLVEKAGETRTVERVLEILEEKYSKTECEKLADLMKRISGFKMAGSVDQLIDDFEEMMMEVKSLRLVDRLEYALSAQFVERLKEGGKVNSSEKIRLKDILETK